MPKSYKIIQSTLFAILFLCLSLNSYAQKVERIEPLCWWEGMNTDLQLMIYGHDLQGSTVRVLEEGITIEAVHNAESPNYLFVDVAVSLAGKYTLEIAKGKKTVHAKYEIHSRRSNSASRVGFTSADVIYLIMPDRFANGDEANDKILGEKQILDRKGLEDRHGGDIQGIINHLDYMADLGVTTLWSTPLLDDNLYYHQYSCSDYYKVDPHFGTNELYKKMVSKAHEKGLKVIQDVIPNHCGAGHWWMKDLPFNSWVHQFDIFTQSNYALQAFSDPHASQADRDICSKGWFVETLPDMNLSNPFVVNYLSQMAIWWIEYADLDGLRVDTYFYMGKESATWTKKVRDEYPNLNLVGEVWGNDPAIIFYWLGSAKNKDGFTSHLPKAMDFPLERALVTGFASDNEAWGGGMRSIYNTIAQDFVYDNPAQELVTFADNHDIDRIYNMLGKDLAKVKMAMTLLCTTRGTPQIYYGTELLFEDDTRGGLHKMRMDFPGGWVKDTLNLFEAKNRTKEQNDMYNHLRTLLHFRKQTTVLHTGKLMHYVPKDNVYTCFRYNDSECVMTIINASQSEQKIDWKRFAERLINKEKGIDILSDKNIIKETETTIAARTSMVIHFK